MSGRYRYSKSVLTLKKSIQEKQTEFPGSLGLTIGGYKYVEVPNRAGYVYVRLRDDLSEVVQAYNDKVSLIYGLPVIVVRDQIDKGRWYIKGRDIGRYGNWGSTAYLPRHGSQHSFNPASPGADVVWVYGRQWMPMAAVPSGAYGGPNVIIQECVYYRDNAFQYVGTTGTADITAYKPTGSDANIILVWLDEYNNPQLTEGLHCAESVTGTQEILQYLPPLPNSNALPIAGIRLVSGTSYIGWENIYDLRPMIVGDSFIPTGTTGHIIQDDGVAKTQRTNLNFVGDTFVVYDDSGNDATIVSGTATGGGGGTYDAGDVPYAGGAGTLTSDGIMWYSAALQGMGIGLDYSKVTDNGYIAPLSLKDQLGIFRFNATNTNSPYFYMYRSRGTETALREVLSGDRLWTLEGRANSASGTSATWRQVTDIQSEALENISSTRRGAKVVFRLAPTGTSSLQDALDVRSNISRFTQDITLLNAGKLHFGDENSDGSFRLVNIGDAIYLQKRVAGAWVTGTSLSV